VFAATTSINMPFLAVWTKSCVESCGFSLVGSHGISYPFCGSRKGN